MFPGDFVTEIEWDDADNEVVSISFSQDAVLKSPARGTRSFPTVPVLEFCVHRLVGTYLRTWLY